MQEQKIKLTNVNEFVIVDREDYSSLSQYKWYKDANGYAVSRINDKTTYMHRVVTKCPKNMTVDHINRNTLDNRKENLRTCTRGQNNCNKLADKKNKTSQYKGVSRRGNKWGVYIHSNKQLYYLGRFYNEHYAAYQYNLKVKELQGEYAHLNDINYSVEELEQLEKADKLRLNKGVTNE